MRACHFQDLWSAKEQNDTETPIQATQGNRSKRRMPDENEKQGAEQVSLMKSSWLSKISPEWLSAIVATFALILSVISIIFTCNQSEYARISAEAARTSAKTAEESTKLTKRSLEVSFAITNSYVTIIRTTRTVEPYTTTIIENKGKVAAERVQIKSRLDLMISDFSGDVTYPLHITQTNRYGVIPAGDVRSINDTLDVRLSTSEFEDVSRDRWLFLHIQIGFCNGFGDSLTTNFGLKHDTFTNSFTYCSHTGK